MDQIGLRNNGYVPNSPFPQPTGNSYSPVPNNGTGTFILFNQKGPPVRAYLGAIFILFPRFGLVVLLF